jgi:hypothetical protein
LDSPARKGRHPASDLRAGSDGKPKSFAGTYSLNGKSLVMVRDGSNEKVEGLLTLNDPSNFNLKANGSEPGDTGLSFAR